MDPTRSRQSFVPPAAAAARPAAFHILIVEDNGRLTMMLAETLGLLGHNIRAVALSPAEAAEAAARHSPDIMIVDAGLVRESDPPVRPLATAGNVIPFILMTAEGAEPSPANDAARPEAFHKEDLIRAVQSVTGAGPRDRHRPNPHF